MISKYSVVEPEDLWRALQDALDETAVLRNKFRIQKVMDTWIGQKGYPLVTVTKDWQTGRTAFTQECFRPYKKFGMHRNISKTDAGDARWWIPINFATRSNPDFSSTSPAAWLSPQVDELVITDGTAPQDWIIVNVQHTGKGTPIIGLTISPGDYIRVARECRSISRRHVSGFYHVNYDATNWLKIADYLDSEDYSKVHALNRAQIVNDAMYLMFADKLDPEIFMSITRYLRRETDLTAWYPLFAILEDALKFYAYNDGGESLKVSSLALSKFDFRNIEIPR